MKTQPRETLWGRVSLFQVPNWSRALFSGLTLQKTLMVKDLWPLKHLYFNTQSQDFTVCVHSELVLSLDKEPTPNRNIEIFCLRHVRSCSVMFGRPFQSKLLQKGWVSFPWQSETRRGLFTLDFSGNVFCIHLAKDPSQQSRNEMEARALWTTQYLPF